MIRIDISRTIERPIEAVYARLADIDGYSSWMPRSSIFRQSRLWHPGTAGEQAFEERTILGTLRGRIVTSEPPRRIAFRQVLRVRGLVVFESRPRYVLTPLDHGTTLVRHRVWPASSAPFASSSRSADGSPGANGRPRWRPSRPRSRAPDRAVRPDRTDRRGVSCPPHVTPRRSAWDCRASDRWS